MYSRSSNRSLAAALRLAALAPASSLTVAGRGLASTTIFSSTLGGDQAQQCKEATTCTFEQQCRRRVSCPASKSSFAERPKPSLYGLSSNSNLLFPATTFDVRDSESRSSFSRGRYEATVAQSEATDAPAEKFEYQAEVSRLLDLIVNSLYSHKEVFLRELISNASDAIDKFRFLSVTDPGLLSTGSDLEIKIKADTQNGIINIIDTGIGMTKEELIESLGTIAQSGTAKFLKALKDSKEGGAGDSNLIGQFGVGFYSAFLVAQKVAVSTKSPKSDKQYVWEGEADSNSYIVQEETNPEKLLPRGTSITLFLKKDAKHEYTDSTRILNLVKNYSQFISFPIYLWQEKTREVEAADDTNSKDSVAEQDTDSQEKEKQIKKKKKTISEKYFDWEMVNNTKPIWMRSPKEVAKEEYTDFYKKTFNQFLEPMAHTHFTTEGEVEFRSLLYIPGMAPITADEASGPKVKNIRLYVKRVFISDEFDGELFPRYLGFIRGVVDSNDVPLNVSREILQESRIVRLMKKRLVKKSFEMIEDIAKRENKEDYEKFWKNFGKYIKMGCIDDAGSRKQLVPLLRFYSSKHEDEMISLKAYVENMKKDQKAIYYFAADTIKSAKSAPFLEELLQRDLEVLYLIEPIDEIAITNLKSFDGKKFLDISKEELDIGEKDKSKDNELQKEYSPLCDWMKKQLGDKVAKVQISKRLKSSPCVLVNPSHGWSANMERIMKAQALGDTLNSAFDFARGSRILEVNPNHPIIKGLNDVYKGKSENSSPKQVVELLYETALLSGGYTLEDPSTFGMKVFEMMATALKKHKEVIQGDISEGTTAVLPGEDEAEIVGDPETLTSDEGFQSFSEAEVVDESLAENKQKDTNMFS